MQERLEALSKCEVFNRMANLGLSVSERVPVLRGSLERTRSSRSATIVSKPNSATSHYNYALSHIAMARFGKPEDIIGTTLLFASEAGAFVAGQTIFVDGGRAYT